MPFNTCYTKHFILYLPCISFNTSKLCNPAPVVDEAEKEAENELQQALERARRAKLKQSVKLTCMYVFN